MSFYPYHQQAVYTPTWVYSFLFNYEEDQEYHSSVFYTTNTAFYSILSTSSRQSDLIKSYPYKYVVQIIHNISPLPENKSAKKHGF